MKQKCIFFFFYLVVDVFEDTVVSGFQEHGILEIHVVLRIYS